MTKTQTPDPEMQSALTLEMLRHPVRQRIVSWLGRHPKGQTQRELGETLALSTAAIHYHIKLLAGIGVVAITSTRPGPNGITEKLYALTGLLTLTRQDRGVWLLESTFAHMREMQREGEALLDMNGAERGYLAGAYESYASEDETLAFASGLLAQIEAFQAAHARPKAGTRPTGITVGVLPSKGSGWSGRRMAVDFLAP